VVANADKARLGQTDYFRARDPDASGIGPLKPSNHPQQSALSSAAAPHQDTDFSAGELTIQALEYATIAKGQGHPLNLDVTGLCFRLRHAPLCLPFAPLPRTDLSRAQAPTFG